MDEGLSNIIKRRNFSNFWECVSFLIDAGYDESKALMCSLESFEGDIWGKVITVAKYKPESRWNVLGLPDGNREMTFASGGTYTFVATSGTTLNWVNNNAQAEIPLSPPLAQEDILDAHIYIMTEKSNKYYNDLYKAYIETRKYEEILDLEDHFKRISIRLNSEVGIRLFNDGYKKFK